MLKTNLKMKAESDKKKRANSYYVFNVLMESSGWYFIVDLEEIKKNSVMP